MVHDIEERIKNSEEHINVEKEYANITQIIFYLKQEDIEKVETAIETNDLPSDLELEVYKSDIMESFFTNNNIKSNPITKNLIHSDTLTILAYSLEQEKKEYYGKEKENRDKLIHSRGKRSQEEIKKEPGFEREKFTEKIEKNIEIITNYLKKNEIVFAKSIIYKIDNPLHEHTEQDPKKDLKYIEFAPEYVDKKLIIVNTFEKKHYEELIEQNKEESEK